MTRCRSFGTDAADKGGNVRRDVVIVGAGRLGRSAIRTLGDRVAAVVTGNPDRLRDEFPDGRFSILPSLDELSQISFDTLWLAVPDQVIRDVAVSAAAVASVTWNDKAVLHSSGATGTDVLQPLKEAGAAIAVVHPNAILSGDEPFPKKLVWGITLDGRGRDWVLGLLPGADPHLFDIDENHRALYHAAASLAANYSMTLFDAARTMYAAAGLDSDLAGEVVGRFMNAAVASSHSYGFAEGLTGPVARGDIGTVERHLIAICATVPELSGLVVELVRTTVRLLGSDRMEEWEAMIGRVNSAEGRVNS